jgi:hypothetical protein
MSGPLSLLVNYPGWTGQHTREEAERALKNGTRVRKIRLAPVGGASGRSTSNRAGFGDCPWGPGYGYFVEWDDQPREAVFIASDRLTQDKCSETASRSFVSAALWNNQR